MYFCNQISNCRWPTLLTMLRKIVTTFNYLESSKICAVYNFKIWTMFRFPEGGARPPPPTPEHLCPRIYVHLWEKFITFVYIYKNILTIFNTLCFYGLMISCSISIYYEISVKIVKIVIFRVYIFICTRKSEQPTFRNPPTQIWTLLGLKKNTYIFLDTPLLASCF